MVWKDVQAFDCECLHPMIGQAYGWVLGLEFMVDIRVRGRVAVVPDAFEVPF